MRLNIKQLPYYINIKDVTKDVTNYENVIILINAIIQMFHCRYFFMLINSIRQLLFGIFSIVAMFKIVFFPIFFAYVGIIIPHFKISHPCFIL